MDELDDQLRRLADQRADRVTATSAADAMAPTGHRGGHTVWWLAAAAMLAVLAGTGAWFALGSDDEGTTDVAVTTTTAAAPTTTPPTTTSDVAETHPLASGREYDLAVASADGIALRTPATHEVTTLPIDSLTGARIAFVLPGPTVIYESGLSGRPDSIITIATESGETVIADGRVQLLDAAIVDGVPTALITRRTGDTPETADERLFLIDLDTIAETDLGRVGGWESSVADARLGDGAIATRRSAEAFGPVQAISYTGDVLWSTVEEWDPTYSLAVDEQNVYLIDLQPGDDGATVRWQVLDLGSGEALGQYERPLVSETGESVAIDGCMRQVWWVFGWCSVEGTGVPMQLDLELGLIYETPGFDETLTPGLITRTHEVSTTLPEPHPCGRGPVYYHEPDALSSTPIELPDGRTMDVVLWQDVDRVLVQGFLGDWVTNRLSLENWSPLTIDRIGEIELYDSEYYDDDRRFDVFISGEGGVTVEFDGCELSIVNGFVI